MDRRNFLKMCAAAIGGILLMKLTRWFSFDAKRTTKLKEARFYKQTDRLAG